MPLMLGVRRLVVVCAASLAVGATGAAAHADELCGVYELRKDSDGDTPKKDSTIRLTLRNGKARVVAKRPSAKVTDRGKYTLHSRSRITIRFNELPFRARKKPYRLEGSSLTLPFKALSDGSGTSLWRRVSPCGSTGKRGKKETKKPKKPPKKKPPTKPKDDDSDEADH